MTAKAKKIISELDACSEADKEAVRKHLNGSNGQAKVHPRRRGKSLTRVSGNGYNAHMPIAAKPPKFTPNGVGKKIAERREAKGLSQVELATEVGISQVSISNIERGQRGIRSTTLRCIAAALGTTVNELLAAT